MIQTVHAGCRLGRQGGGGHNSFEDQPQIPFLPATIYTCWLITGSFDRYTYNAISVRCR